MKKLVAIAMLVLFTVHTIQTSSTPRNLSKRQLCIAIPITVGMSCGAFQLACYTFHEAGEASGLVLKSVLYGTSGTSAFVSVISVGASAMFAHDLVKKFRNR
jgi:hypothetical protein